MSLSKCQICGDALFTDELPWQHFCINLDGDAIVKPRSAPIDSPMDSGTHTPEPHSPKLLVSEPAVHDLVSRDELAEIGRLHLENEHLKALLPRLELAVEDGHSVAREIQLPNGRRVVVEVVIHPV